MAQEEQLLSSSIVETLKEASAAETRLSYVQGGIGRVKDIDNNDNLNETDYVLTFYIEKLYRDVGILAERLGLPQFKSEITEDFRKSKGQTEMQIEPGDIQLRSQSLARVRSYYHSLAIMTDSQAVTGLDVFRNILQNTPAIVKLKALEPTNEAVVRKAIFEVLKISFHDAVREIPIGQLLKTYKPDLGVRSLMAAAEYKFCSSETELKKSVGEVFSDMKGYEGHHEWRNFYAVFYTTEPILHQDRLEKEFAGVKANANWTPIIVVGRGRRPVKPAKRT